MRIGRVLLLTIALGAALSAALVWRAYRSDMDRARARALAPSEVAQSPFGPLQYATRGSGQTLLMIHGSGGGFDQGLAFSAPLVRRGFKVVAPSRFGYLESGFPEGASPAMQADALDWLLDHLGEARVVIVGGSAGALSAAQLALRHPDRCAGLVLLVPAIWAPDRRPNESAAPGPIVRTLVMALLRSDFLFWAAARLAPNTMTEMLLATDPALLRDAAPAEQAWAREVLYGILPVSARARGLLLDSATAGDPPPYPLDQIACPVLAVSAADDLYGTGRSAAHAARVAPSGRLVLYPSGGHLLVGHGEEGWSEIAAFARQAGSARAASPSSRREASVPGI